MNAILAAVIESAAMMRSPSFSRSWESRTIMNSPFSVVTEPVRVYPLETNSSEAGEIHTECRNRFFDSVELQISICF